jgi:hypothetical protein
MRKLNQCNQNTEHCQLLVVCGNTPTYFLVTVLPDATTQDRCSGIFATNVEKYNTDNSHILCCILQGGGVSAGCCGGGQTEPGGAKVSQRWVCGGLLKGGYTWRTTLTCFEGGCIQ